jgi:hypothetical protein
MMTETDLSTWLVTMEAAMRIGCSTRTIERLGRAKKLEQRLRPQKGSPPVVVYNPDDVARIASERRPAPAPFVLGAVQGSNGNGPEPSGAIRTQTRLSGAIGMPADDDPIRQLFAAALRAVLSPPSPPMSASVAETVYLDVEQAAAVLNWTPRDLRRAIRDGDVPCRFGARRNWRRWRIRRKDLEAL